MKNVTWVGADLGGPALAGRTEQVGDELRILAGGADMWGRRDEGHFAHMRVSGDFDLAVQVRSLEMADLYTKAGIMARTSLDASAAHVFLLTFGDNQPRNNNNGGVEAQARDAEGAECRAFYPPQPLPAAPEFPANFPNVWLRLTRTADVFFAAYSADGVNWKPYATFQLRLPAELLLGIAVTSHHPSRPVRAVFRLV